MPWIGHAVGAGDDDRIILFDWLKANFTQRAETLHAETGSEFKLEYDYMGATEDKKRLRVFERFATGSLPGSAAQKHIESCLSVFERIRKALAAMRSIGSAISTTRPMSA